MCAMQGECTEENKEHGKHSLSYHRRWDATSTDECRCFKRGEKKRILSSKEKFVADCTAHGFHGPIISKSLKIKVMKTYFLSEQLFFKADIVLQHSIMTARALVHSTSKSTKRCLLASRTGHCIAGNLKGGHSIAVRILNSYPTLHRMGASDKAAAGSVLHRKKGTSEEAG